jgi:hypothetical protein
MMERFMIIRNRRSSARAGAWGFLAVLLLACAPFSSARACPNCGLDVVEEQKGGRGIKDGFTYSIVGLASMPFLIAATAGGFILRASRRQASADDAGEEG